MVSKVSENFRELDASSPVNSLAIPRSEAMAIAERWIADCSELCMITRFDLRPDGYWFFEHQPCFNPAPSPAMEKDGWGVALINLQGRVEPLVGQLSFHRRIMAFERVINGRVSDPAKEIDLEQAHRTARQYLAAACFFEPVSIYTDRIITKPYGWIFYYQSKRFLVTQDKRFKLIKSAPLLVSKANGKVALFGSVGYKNLAVTVTPEMRRKMKDLSPLAQAEPIPGQAEQTPEQARYVAQAYLDARYIDYDSKNDCFSCQMSLLPDKTEEKPNGWKFSYASKDTANENHGQPPIGSGPILIHKNDGSIFEMFYRPPRKHTSDE